MKKVEIRQKVRVLHESDTHISTCPGTFSKKTGEHMAGWKEGYMIQPCEDCIVGVSCYYGEDVYESDDEEWLLETIEDDRFNYCPVCGKKLK